VDAGTGVVYVGRQDGAVTLLATRAGRVLRALPASTGRPGAIPGAGAEGLARVYRAPGYTWAGIPGNALDILDARTGRLLGWTWSSGPNAVVVDRHTQHVFVPVGGPGSVSMLDAHTGRLLRTVLLLSLPLQRRTPLVLLSRTVRRNAPRLVHRQNRGHKQHQ
jgi:hypothetical protein